MKIKTLLAISVSVAALAGLSVIAVESGKEPRTPGTAEEMQCPPDQTNPETGSLKVEGTKVMSVENKDMMCKFKKEASERGKDVAVKEEDASEGEKAVLKPEEEARQYKWRTDYRAALKLAQETNRPILVEFVGSDWCGWCKKLEKEVTSQKEFQDYAKEHLVLFVADFPRQTKLPADLKRQNEALAEKHKIEGFPTVLLLNPKGEALARTGYRPGGAEAYVNHVQDLLKKTETGKKPSA